MALIHGFILALINLGSILVGFAVYHLAGSRNQIAIQVPVAVLCTIIAFCLWVRMTSRTRLRWRGGVRPGLAVFFLALIGAAVVFVPLHYATQGYVTAWSNVTALWAFQVPANLLALLVAQRVLAPSPETEEHA
jgi:hypothetical protein